MKLSISKTSVLLVCMLGFNAFAQPNPDPSLWQNVGATNPNGEYPVPLVIYDRTTGILSIDTLGMNRTDDTPDYSGAPGPIVDDDVAFFGLTLDLTSQGNPSDYQLLSPFDTTIFQGRAWGGSVTETSVDLFSTGLNESLFLWPGKYDIAQLPSDLTSNNFSFIIIDTNPEQSMIAGHQSLNGVTVVPEPDSGVLFLMVTVFLRAIQTRNSGRTKGTPNFS